MAQAAPRELTITIAGTSRVSKLAFTDTTFVTETSRGQDVTCWTYFFRPFAKIQYTETALRNVVAASYVKGYLDVQYLIPKGKNRHLKLRHIQGTIDSDHDQLAKDWCDALMDLAYMGVKRSKMLRVLINPHGGTGKAGSVFTHKVEPMLTAAGCTLDVTYTSYANHALEIARDLKLKYDAVVLVSGDGLIHEVLNGFAQHEQPEKAFCVPIAPIPAGSGNALSLNLLGYEEGIDPYAAALNVLKGQHMKIDLFSFTQGTRQRISFMSQTVGLMADLDVGTEHLRWMGEFRFLVGYLWGVFKRPICPIELSMKVVNDDKKQMVNELQSRKAGLSNNASFNGDDKHQSSPDMSTDEWVSFDKPILWYYAGQGPYVSRGLMQFPVSFPDDGLIDISVQGVMKRAKLIDVMEGAEEGRTYWMDSNHYFKASAYRVKPLNPRGVVVVDGEELPFEEFEVAVQPRLGTVLSPCKQGCYAADFRVCDERGSKSR
ncbi:ATP-NAD kinase-like domain-containing protein [Hygrophoropsis aurantiaca]|uniref:ATP-NAD kinase-like domain-containing protein n=1 Tax=Hygrophoropsis aurantiaca TaxID=72124 RepID=A0ACB7ZWU7_9AGAM|nr:ATP-NAD kinase-like domain-containing protein [Hygrophoropsis aurantiaca]